MRGEQRPGRGSGARSSRLPRGLLARQVLPALDDDVAVARLDLEPDARSAELLGSDQRRAGAKERIEHDIVRPAVVADRPGHRLDRLLGAVSGLVLVAARVVEVPNRALRPVADPLARLALADRVPAGLVLPVVVAAGNGE